MDAPKIHRVGPLPGARLDAVAKDWMHRGTVAIAGRRGSGRRAVADALLERRHGAAETWRIDCAPHPAHRPFDTLESLGLVDAVPPGSTPEAVARSVLTRVRTASIVIEHAEHADVASLRTLVRLTRKTPSIRVIATIDRATVDLEGLADLQGMPLETLEPLDRAATMDLLERMVGSRPTFVDAHLIQQAAAGSFRTIRWLVELVRAHDGIVLDHGRARLLLPRLADTTSVPSWALDVDLVEDPAARMLALLGALPVSSLESLGVEHRCSTLERAGIVHVVDGEVRFVQSALAYDIATRAGAIERRVLTQRLLRTLRPADLCAPVAAVLWHRAVDAGLDAPPWVLACAIASATSTGRHREAIAIAAAAGDHAAGLPDLVLSSVMLGDPAALPSWLDDPALGDTDTAEGVALALVVAELRLGGRSPFALHLDAVQRRLQQHPHSDAVVRAYVTLIRPGSRLDESALQAIVDDTAIAPSTRARAMRVLAMRAWMDGRPVAASSLLAVADAVHPGVVVDAAIGYFLRVTAELLRPDLDACIEALLDGVEPGDASTLRSLLAAALGIYSGAIAVARMHLRRLTAGGQLHDQALEPITLPMLSIAESMLGDDARACAALDAAAETRTRSAIIDAGSLHLRGVAVTQLRVVPDHDEGLACYAAAAQAAEPLDFRLLLGVATYRRAMELDEGQRTAAVQMLRALRDGDRPLDGVPGMLAELGDALEAHDVRRLVDIAGRLHRAGLIQDAKVVAMRLAASAIMSVPARAQRAIARLARHRFDTAPAVEGPQLTPREQDVARLVLAGMTDRQIADRLELSPRTASVHVGRILRKLGIASRRELTADLAMRSGVADARAHASGA